MCATPTTTTVCTACTTVQEPLLDHKGQCNSAGTRGARVQLAPPTLSVLADPLFGVHTSDATTADAAGAAVDVAIVVAVVAAPVVASAVAAW